MSNPIDIRYTSLGDEKYLREWLLSKDILHFFPMGSDKEVDDAIKCWIGFAKYSASITAVINGEPCGIATLFLMPYKKVAHHCIFKIIVDPKHQRKGIGTDLVKNIKHLAKNYFHLELLHAEVFAANPLIDLLEKQGFRIYATQVGFVKENGKSFDKILLECDLTAS